MKIPERYKTPLLALLAAVMAILGLLSADIAGDDTTTTTTSSTAPPDTTTTTVPQSTTTTAPTTTTTAPELPEPFADVSIADWIVDGRDWGVSDDSWEPSGNLRLACELSHLAHADPIVYPGVDDVGHLHMFFGNTAANGRSTFDTLQREGGGTCDGGPLNRTAYWMPAVLDGEGNVVAPSSFELYYKAANTTSRDEADLAQRQAEIQQVQPYPDGLRMIAGAPGGGWYWRCGNGPESQTIPPCDGGQRLTVSVRFPYCWNGRDLDSADHRSHMAYGVGDGGWNQCPASHPIHVPELTEFAHFDGVDGTDGWTISSDMGAAPGSTFHADWFGAWHPEIEDTWLANCLHGMRGTSGGTLCDRLNPPFSDEPLRRLRPAPNYTGPNRIPGYTPMAD